MLMQQEVSLKFFHDGEARPQCRLLWQTVYTCRHLYPKVQMARSLCKECYRAHKRTFVLWFQLDFLDVTVHFYPKSLPLPRHLKICS